MSRIANRFAQMAEHNRKVLIPYIVAGDPELSATVPLMHDLVRAGADVIELGVPFSDPMSEGPVIALAHERALAAGTTLKQVLAMVSQFRQHDSDTPVLLMGYANPVEHMGYGVFADAAAEAGVDGLLSVDIPPEEVAAVKAELNRVGMDNIFLIAPTTPQQRIATITAQASGFIYYVSLKGVTGAGHLDHQSVARHVEMIRQSSELPVAVGFGIKDAESACSVASSADAVVVGSALVDVYAQVIAAGDGTESAQAAVVELLSNIRKGLDNGAS